VQSTEQKRIAESLQVIANTLDHHELSAAANAVRDAAVALAAERDRADRAEAASVLRDADIAAGALEDFARSLDSTDESVEVALGGSDYVRGMALSRAATIRAEATA